MRKPLVIAQIVQHLAPGGIETMVLDLQKQALTPCEVHIFSLEGTRAKAIENWPRIQSTKNIHFFDKPPGFSLNTIKSLARQLKALNAEVVHTHHVGPLLYGGIAAKLSGCRHVHTEHDAWHLNNQKRRWLVGACFHLLRPNVVADAELVANNIKRHIPFFKPAVILNGIDTNHFQPESQSAARNALNIPQNVPVIGCAARFTEVKCHHLLLEAFSKLPENTHLALAGGGELEHTLKDQASKLGIHQRVHFLGVINDMPGFYHAIDIFCLPSKKEGMPLSPLEAQSCQRVVVITDVGGCSEAVDPFSGLLIAPENVNALTTALQQQLDNGTTPEKQQSARRFVLENCNLERMIRQYTDLYIGRSI